ncbi:hypothetical protein CEXT_301501 [Caerostris extrusa]|uniref:Uncharacterized protein n=1 Tax=Caerostris extrusa TaxID=172846 RepID=A0AAV4Q586_CAEEX|nr:hypothetical protein CEXT_301501 [Caerostris extrusa]
MSSDEFNCKRIIFFLQSHLAASIHDTCRLKNSAAFLCKQKTILTAPREARTISVFVENNSAYSISQNATCHCHFECDLWKGPAQKVDF